MQKNNIMIDLETMSLSSNAVIVALGAVRFGLEITDSYYCAIDLQSCLDVGLEVSGETINWWLLQSDGARAMFLENQVPLKKCLQGFDVWAGDRAVVWGGPSSFDNAILENAYRKTGFRLPWDRRKAMCYKTYVARYPEIPFVRRGIEHYALDDARYQALHLIEILLETGRADMFMRNKQPR